MRPLVVISKLYTKMNNFNKIPDKYFVNTLIKLKKYFCPSFSLTFTQKRAQK